METFLPSPTTVDPFAIKQTKVALDDGDLSEDQGAYLRTALHRLGVVRAQLEAGGEEPTPQEAS